MKRCHTYLNSRCIDFQKRAVFSRIGQFWSACPHCACARNRITFCVLRHLRSHARPAVPQFHWKVVSFFSFLFFYLLIFNCNFSDNFISFFQTPAEGMGEFCDKWQPTLSRTRGAECARWHVGVWSPPTPHSQRGHAPPLLRECELIVNGVDVNVCGYVDVSMWEVWGKKGEPIKWVRLFSSMKREYEI